MFRSTTSGHQVFRTSLWGADHIQALAYIYKDTLGDLNQYLTLNTVSTVTTSPVLYQPHFAGCWIVCLQSDV